MWRAWSCLLFSHHRMCLFPLSMKVKDVLEPVITLNFVPGVGIFQCVSTGMTITGKRLVWEGKSGGRRLSSGLILPCSCTVDQLFIM